MRVARTGSFSRAGREFGLSQPSTSRIIAELEREIGASLFTRTTRAVILTETGADYLARIEPLLAGLEDADQAARGTGELRGTLRVGISTSFAIRVVIPRTAKFSETHPLLRIDFLMEDQRQDLVRQGVDVALRLGMPSDSTAMAKKIGVGRRLIVASPSYLARYGTPKTPGDLANHAAIIGPAGTGPDGWSFERDGRTVSVRVEGRVTATVNEGAIAAAVAGLGIVSTGSLGCAAELASGALVEILKDWKMGYFDVHAVFTAGRAAKPSARAFVDYLAASLRDAP